MRVCAADRKGRKDMITIRSMIANKLRQKGESDHSKFVREIACRLLERVCEELPDETPEGREFADVMLKLQDQSGVNPIDVLVASVMEERDDLACYPKIRLKLESAINDWKTSVCVQFKNVKDEARPE